LILWEFGQDFNQTISNLDITAKNKPAFFTVSLIKGQIMKIRIYCGDQFR
jgi:hypothetical protein